MKPVTDPALLEQLNARSGFKPVTDPATLAQLHFGIDFSKGEEETRSAILRLPDDQKRAATDLFGRHIVANEPLQNDLPSPAAGIPFTDELASGANAGIYALSGGSFGRPYNEGMAVEKARRNRSAERYPVLSTAATIGGALTLPVPPALRATSAGGRLAETTAIGGGYGAVSGLGEGQGAERLENAATGGVGGAVAGGILGGLAESARGIQKAYARTGQTGAYDKFASQLGDTTLNQLADDVAGGATRQNVNINRATLDILGEEMVRAGNPQAAAQATVQRMVAELGISPGAATARLRRLTQVHQDSPLMLGEYPAVAESNRATRLTRPENVDLAEVSQITNKGTQDLVDYLANSGAGRAVDRTRNAIEDRQAGISDWFRGRLQRMAPNGQTLDDAENMIDGVRRLARQDYEAAYNAPGGTAVNYRILHGLLPRVAERHLDRMRGRSGEQAQALRQAIEELYIDLPTGQRLIMPSLQQAQDMRQAIRGMIERADRSGNTHIAATLRPFYQDVTRVMERSSPAWSQANRRWAGMSRLEDALEFGQRLSSKASVAQRQALREFDNLAPEARDLVRVGWLQQQFDKLGELRDTHDVSKLFDRQNMFNTVARLFGRRDAVELARAVRDAEVANRSTRMLGNSATHRRGMMQRTMDAETGIVAAAENASMKGARNWLVEKLTGVLRDRRNVPLSNIVTTPMSDTAAVAGHIERARRAQERLRVLDRPARERFRAGAAAGTAIGASLDNGEPDLSSLPPPSREPLPGMMRLGGPKPPDHGAGSPNALERVYRNVMEHLRSNALEGTDKTLPESFLDFGERAATEVLPFALGPAGKGISAAMRAAPTLSRSLIGAAGITAASGRAGDSIADAPNIGNPQADEAALRDLRTQRAALVEQMNDQTANREANRPGKRVPNPAVDVRYFASDKEVKKLESQISGLDGQISDLRNRMSPEFKREQALKNFEAAEKERERVAETPTRKRFAELMPYMPIITGVAATALAGGIKGKAIANFNREVAEITGRWLSAVQKADRAYKSGNAKALENATTVSNGLKTQFDALMAKGPGGTAEAVEAGAAVSLLGAFAPEEVDFARAAAGSPLWQSLRETVIDDWAGTLERAGISVALGAGLGHLSSLGVKALLSKPAPAGYGPETTAANQNLRRLKSEQRKALQTKTPKPQP